MNKISIILPIYNTVDYLEKCLSSVCKQTYKNLEIICVDDGSTDGSEIILNNYSEKDKRIIAIHQENGGESNARNTGLRLATGQFIGFMDCDDWIEPRMYEALLDAMLKYDVDLVASSWYKDTDVSSEKIFNSLSVKDGVFGREELLNYIYKRDYYRGFTYMWNKLYRRNLLYDSEGELILFDESLRLGGDVLYLSRMALNTKRAYYIDKAFYHYYQRETSGCHTVDLERRMDWLTAYKKLILYIDKNNIDTEALIWIKRFLVYHSTNVAELALQQKNREILYKCKAIMKKYEREYKETNIDFPDRIERYERISKSEII